MSTVIEKFDHWDAVRPYGYPWDLWLDGRTHKLTHDDLRDTTFRNFCSHVHDEAKKRGLEARTKRWDFNQEYGVYLSMLVQAYPPGQKPEEVLADG